MFLTMLGSTKFQRVKSLWHTQFGHSKNIQSVGSHETLVQKVTTTAEPDQKYRASVIDDNVETQTPRTPTLDADFHRYTKEQDLQATKLDTISLSLVSSSLTSASTKPPSSSPEKSSPNFVTSMFRTISDACVLSSITSRPPTASALTSSSVSTLLSYVPAVPTPWRSSRSTSGGSSSTNSSTLSFASVSSTSVLTPREAAANAINNVRTVCSRCQTAVFSSVTRGSPYGELVLVDILKARGLVVDRNESGVDVPFIVMMQLSQMRRKTKPAGHDSFAVNERFVFWLPSSSTNDQRTFDIFVRGGDEHDLGEVHLSLAMPINESFSDWYPLVCRADGLKHGSVRVTMRRLVLTSSPMLEAAKILGERESCLSFSDRRDYGELLPEVWSCFPGTGPEVIPASSPKEDDISSKLGRLIGIQDVQRDVF